MYQNATSSQYLFTALVANESLHNESSLASLQGLNECYLLIFTDSEGESCHNYPPYLNSVMPSNVSFYVSAYDVGSNQVYSCDHVFDHAATVISDDECSENSGQEVPSTDKVYLDAEQRQQESSKTHQSRRASNKCKSKRASRRRKNKHGSKRRKTKRAAYLKHKNERLASSKRRGKRVFSQQRKRKHAFSEQSSNISLNDFLLGDTETPDLNLSDEIDDERVYRELTENVRFFEGLIQEATELYLRPLVSYGLGPTLNLATKAMFVAMADRRENDSLINAIYAFYTHICDKVKVRPCSLHTLQRLLDAGCQITKEKNEASFEYNADFSCPLISFACYILTRLKRKASKGQIDEGALAIQAINSRLPLEGIWIADGSSITLPDEAAQSAIQSSVSPDVCNASVGCGRKLHVIYDFKSGSPTLLKMAKGTSNERDFVKDVVDQIPPLTMFLADAGYEEHALLGALDERKIPFIIKAQKKGNRPVKEYCRYHTSNVVINHKKGDSIRSHITDWVDLQLLEHKCCSEEDKIKFQDLPLENNTCIDATVWMEDGSTLRYIQLYNPNPRDKGHPFVHLFTNISKEQLSAMEVYAVYKLRWQVELFFKTSKQSNSMDDVKVKGIGIADFSVFMAMNAYLIKLIMGQTVQANSGKVLSIQSVSKANALAMCKYLGIDDFNFNDNSQEMSLVTSGKPKKKSIRNEKWHYLCSKYGNIVSIHNMLYSLAVKSNVSITNICRIKGIRVIIAFLRRKPPDIITL